MDAQVRIAELEQEVDTLKQRITAQERVEKSLRENERQFSILVNTLPHGVQECGIDGRITFSNPAHHQILEYVPGELIGRFVWDLLANPEERQQLPAYFRKLARDQPPPTPYQAQNRTKTGHLVEVQVDWNYKRDSLGRVVGFISVITDVTERLKASRGLEESQKRYHSLFQKAGDAIFIIEAEGPHAGRILDANRAAEDMHGYSLEELKTMKIQEIDGPEDAQHVAQRLSQMLKGEWIKAEITHRKKDGSLFPVEMSAGIITMGTKKVVLGIDRDMTQRAASKAALNKQIIFLQALIDNLPTPIFYKNAQGRYLGCNKAFELFTGNKREDILDKTVFEISSPDVAQVYHEADQELFRKRTPQIYEARVRNRHGDYRWVLFSKAVFNDNEGHLDGLVGAMLDITERRQAEEENALLAIAIEQTPEMIIMTDPKGLIHYVNPAFERISGHPRQTVLGRTTEFLRNERLDTALYRQVAQTLKADGIWKGRLTNRHKNGQLFEVEATIVPVQRNVGEISGYLTIERDISKEILHEKHLRQAQKMEAIGTLAGGIAHDFNNILSAIIGFTEITMFDLPADSAKRKYLQKVMSAGERARELVHQILTFSRATEQETRPVVVKFIVTEALKLLRATLPSTITIKTDITSKAAILADPTQVHQVVMNLCTNAAYAMREKGGQLSISLSEIAWSSALAERNEEDPGDQHLLLQVKDTGTGMPPEIVDRIFDPFFTTKEIGEGTGMGLAVVHGIVENCGGIIQVDSQVNEGSTISVILPIIETGNVTVVRKETPLPVGHERILFVDDEPAQVELVESMLQRLGYQVVAVNASPLALSLFQKTPDDFDLVVTDMTMPEMTGDILVGKIKEQRPDLPVIICTGYSEKLSPRSVTELGLAGMLHKPLIMKELAQTIRKTLDNVS